MLKQWNIKTKLINTISIIYDDKIEEMILSTPQKNSIQIAKEKYGLLESGKCSLIDEVERFLNGYFNGESSEFDLSKLNLDKFSEFQRDVLKEQCKTPFGKINYYKDIAIAIDRPKSSRAIGNALRNNLFPIIIPCHRTVKANNEIGGFMGDKSNSYKKILLEHEGHHIVKNKIIS